jgi:hypothetical protein
MANLNLSQFTEKTLVADADWVFVWDTAGAISKKVSRNSLLNSGTLATSAPVTISQTWAAVGQTFTAFTVNAAGTSDANSASGSLLLDLQLNGVSQVNVKKSGQTVISSLGSAAAPSFIIGTNAGFYQPTNTQISASANNTEVIRFTAIGIRFGSNELGFGASFSSNDTILLRDGAPNTLALRNSTAAQTFNVYGTYTSGSAYSRLAIACDTSGNATLTTQSTGTAGTVSINGVPVGLGKGNVSTNIAIGGLALITNVSNSGSNVAIGYNSLATLESGNTGGNTAIGAYVLTDPVVSGSLNSALGYTALQYSRGNDNTAIGAFALRNNNVGNKNTALGRNAGDKITGGSSNNDSGSNSLFLGMDTKALGAGQTNQIVIGYDATGLGSNTAVLGNASITTTALRGNVGIGTTAPSSKLQVTGGDVEIETVTSGIIMKAAGTSTRYRITLNAGGTALVFTAI